MWHSTTPNFDLSTYLRELAEESSQTCYSDTKSLEQSKSKSTPARSYSSDSETGSCPGFLSGMTSALSVDCPGEEQLMLFAEASPARTSVLRVKEKELPAHVQDCGRNMQESLMRCGLNLSLPKTHLCLELEDLPPSSKTLPKWGMTFDGECWEVGTRALLTKETECGSWLTPPVQDSNKATKKWREDHQNNLTAQIFNPEKWPTPATRDYKGGHAPKSLVRKDGKSRMDILPNVVAYGGMTTQQLAALDQGSCKETLSVNPSWVEWLMGWPIGWTVLEPLEMDKFLLWLDLHGKPSLPDGYSKVVFADQCAPCEFCDDVICPICSDHYAECDCIGPTEDGVNYKEILGEVYGKRLEE
tara:strand:- start:5668 stop:6741 length:1074 start_codon:yes stop_codon:yes gene_type:complete